MPFDFLFYLKHLSLRRPPESHNNNRKKMYYMYFTGSDFQKMLVLVLLHLRNQEVISKQRLQREIQIAINLRYPKGVFLT